ncbi:MAG: hypothetical protein Q9182_001015 [Xanthomendoza sp. 2 TL-2023]
MAQNSPKKTGKGVTWDAVADAQLFKCVVHLHALTKGDCKALEQGMRAAGYDCSASAISHRIQRLKDKASESTNAASSNANSGNDTDAADPPTSAKPPAAKKSHASPKKKGVDNVSTEGKTAVNGKATANGKAVGGKGANKRKRNDIKEEGEEENAGVDEAEHSGDDQGVKKFKIEEDAEVEEGLEV